MRIIGKGSMVKGLVAGFAMLVGGASSAAAQAGIQVTGSATGCFYTGMAGSCTPTTTATLDGLVYTGNPLFTGFTNSFGEASFGGVPDNFGSFSLASTGFTFGAPGSPTNFFTLMLSFTSPSTGSTQFNATVTGEVSQTATGGAFINFFNNDFQAVSGSGGLLQARVNDVNIQNGQTLQVVSGAVTVTPEPASLVLMATGLAGVYGAARRRRKA